MSNVFQKGSPTLSVVTWLKDDQNLILFGKNIPDTAVHQMMVEVSISFNVCSCTTWGNQNITYLLNVIGLIDYLLKITHKAYFVLLFPGNPKPHIG